MTTDLQRMHQDEWLAALRSAEEQGFSASSLVQEPRCVLGRAVAIFDPTNQAEDRYADLGSWLGVSMLMVRVLYRFNDCNRYAHLRDAGTGKSFDEIADWFKEQRDAHDGDLSDWKPS